MPNLAVSTSHYWRQVPTGWRLFTDQELEDFAMQAVHVLRHAATDSEPRQDPSTTQPMATIAHWWTTEQSLSATDLLLLACGGYTLPATTADTFLRPDSTHRAAIMRAAHEVSDDIPVAMAGPDTLVAMEQLHANIDAALAGAHLRASQRDQAAVFLCARLRPRLFPPSTQLTGPVRGQDRWSIYRAVLDDNHVRGALNNLRKTANPNATDLALLETAAHQEAINAAAARTDPPSR